MNKRIFSLVLALILALSLLPVAAFAASGEATQEPAEIVEEAIAESVPEPDGGEQSANESDVSTFSSESETLAVLSDGGEGGTTTSYIQQVSVCNLPLTSGKYYTAINGTLSSTGNDAAPASGYVHYDASTGVLTLNNISLTASSYGVNVPEEKGYLTIKVVGTSTLTTGSRGMNMPKVDCTITGGGTLIVTTEDWDAFYVKSLTVDSGITLNATANGTSSQPKAISATYNVLLKGTVAAKTNDTDGAAISSDYGDITIESGADVSADGDGYGLNCSRGTFYLKGGKLSAASKKYDTIWSKNIQLSGGELSIIKSGGGALCASGAVTVSGTANVTINIAGLGIYSESEDVTISGGTVKINSTGSNAIYVAAPNADWGIPGGKKIIISGGVLTASSSGVTLWGYKGVEISGGTVNVTSSAEAGIFSPAAVNISAGAVTSNAYYVALQGNAGVEISGGTVTAKSSGSIAGYSSSGAVAVSGGTLTAISDVHNAVYANQVNVTGGTVAATGKAGANSLVAVESGSINGDAVVYVQKYNDKFTVTKGVVYTGTTVSLASDGKTVLTGGVGTVYGDPNVTGFAQPTSSVLGTVFDDKVEITAADTPYNGGKAEAKPVVTVRKIALNKTLAEGMDYTVATSQEKNPVGSNGTFEIVAKDGSGNKGTKGFYVNVTAKELGWDVSDITVSKVSDGTTDAAQVQGTLKLTGVVEGETVTLSYTSLTAEKFPNSKSGDYNVRLTVSGAKLEGADAGNYTLPTAEIVVTARIEQPAPTATATPAPTARPAQSPKTGDEAMPLIWIALAVLSMAAVAVMAGKKKEK